MEAANSAERKSPESGTENQDNAGKPAMKKSLLSPFLALLFFTAGETASTGSAVLKVPTMYRARTSETPAPPGCTPQADAW